MTTITLAIIIINLILLGLLLVGAIVLHDNQMRFNRRVGQLEEALQNEYHMRLKQIQEQTQWITDNFQKIERNGKTN